MDNQHTTGTSGSMSTLSEVMELAAERGYEAAFKVTPKGLYVPEPERYFSPEQTHIDNFYRFEGISNPEDTSILYLIETADGTRGTLVDAYGMYSDSQTNEFIQSVEDIHKTGL